MNLKEQIDLDIKSAMLAKKREELETLRSIKSQILLAETEKGGEEKLSEETGNKMLMKMAKQRKESAEIFQQQNREDLYQKEMFQLEVINRYLPQPLSEEELNLSLQEIINSVQATGLKDMGKVMGLASKKLAGRVDGKVLSEAVKKILTP